MTARFHAQTYRNSSRRKLTIEPFSFFAMLQTPFLKLPTFCIHTRYLLKLGMVIDSYNDHCSAPFSRACWLVSTTNSIRELEPTLSWNQYLTPLIHAESVAYEPNGVCSNQQLARETKNQLALGRLSVSHLYSMRPGFLSNSLAAALSSSPFFTAMMIL